MSDSAGAVLFREEQRFGRWVVWLVLLAGGVPLIVAFSLGLWPRLVDVMTIGTQPMGETPLVILFLATLAALGGVAWLMAAARLETEVRPGTLLLRYRPFHQVTLPTARIASSEVRRYSPLREFGGWGLRYGFRAGWAWTVSGRMGVQLVLEDGRKILVGSQRAAELRRALDPSRR